MLELIIEPVSRSDRDAIISLVRRAFQDEKYSDGGEHELVGRLMEAEAFRPELALKASVGKRIVGFILLSEIELSGQKGRWRSLSLAPVAVLPEFQRKGVGTALIERAHKSADEMGYGSVLVVGHKEYYPRFGYRSLDEFEMHLPFEVDGEYCFLKPLENYDGQCRGSKAVYPKEFFI